MPQAPRNTSNVKQYQSQQDNDEDTIGTDDWSPTKEAFKSFLKRDYELACSNVSAVLRSSRNSLTLRDIKESCLHSNDVIERVLTSLIASGRVTEERGRYTLVP